LLSEGLGSAEMNAVGGKMCGRGSGRGFGVKTPNPMLLEKLEKLQLGKPRKNVSISF
jgi:hypothetical protein